MQTEKLYYRNCHLYDFTAVVLSCEKTERGYQVCLNATAFYPEGGGQACDLGTLGEAEVRDVQEKEGEIFHLCDRALTVGERVEGHIDSLRRQDLSQQHSGEHIVSGLICRKFSCHNVGFHIGHDCMEIDFDAPIPVEALAEIETAANEAVWKNLPIRCYYPEKEALAAIPYRSKKALDWPVRIVEIEGYDCCACCGVHTEKTGEIGLIKILSCVKLRGGVRLELVCGRRALQWMQRIFAQNLAVSQAFSAKMLETGAAAARMNENLAAEKLRANILQSRIFRQTAQNFAGMGNVCHFEENLNANQLRELADAIAKSCGGWAAVLTQNDGGCNICIIGTDISAPVAALKEKFPTRGGGKPGAFQGSVRAEKEEIMAALQ